MKDFVSYIKTRTEQDAGLADFFRKNVHVIRIGNELMSDMATPFQQIVSSCSFFISDCSMDSEIVMTGNSHVDRQNYVENEDRLGLIGLRLADLIHSNILLKLTKILGSIHFTYLILWFGGNEADNSVRNRRDHIQKNLVERLLYPPPCRR